jgi:NTE family protein
MAQQPVQRFIRGRISFCPLPLSQLILFVFLLCCLPFSATAQDSVRRPKIGLVLSGGGAKGFAHIGVLKVLEEAGVKIDFIGGTSMGAIIGGLYASGYNATQIDSVFRETDFDALLQDYIPRSSKNFYGKRNDEMYALSLPFDKLRIGIPRSYSKGLYNYNLLAKLMHNVRHVRDFNKLPIPFLCIATDIETGEEVLLNKGYLPQAIRASAALPSLFSPVELDGRLLVDGGVTNNYPIDELKKLGADIIIGVDVQDDLKDRKSLKDATRILVQISNLQMMEKMNKKRKQTDVYLKPDISDFSVISFRDGSAIIKKGEEAARACYDDILKLVDTTHKYNRENMAITKDSLAIKGISINKLDNYTRAYVIGKLSFKSGSKIAYSDLKNGVDNLSATQNFSSISYSLDKSDSSDEDELRLNLIENPVRTYLKFGLHYDGLYKSGILTNLTHKRLLFKNDVISADIILGDNFRYNLDYYIDNGFYWSLGFRSRYNRFNRNIATDFSNGELVDQLGLNSINIDFSDVSNQLYVQTLFIQKFIIGAGVELKHLKLESETLQNSETILERSHYWSIFGYLKYDSYDNKHFPKTGWLFTGDFQSYLYSSDFTQEFERFSIAKCEFGIAQTIFRHLTLNIDAEAGVAIGKSSVPFFDFVLGGYGFSSVNNIRQFYGYDFLSISGDTYIKSGFTVDYEIFRKNHLNFSANFANIADNMFDDSDWISSPKYTGYAVGYGMDTIIGPIEIKYSWSPELPKGFTWFSVGFRF